MRKSVIAIIIIVLVVLYTSIFVVKEGERGITLRFGKVLRDSEEKPLVYEPGLHFKIPMIESVKTLDARIQTMDNQADRFVTKEKKDLIVDSYIKWRISDFSRYYLATGGGDVSQAEVLLKRKFSDRLRSEIGRLDVKDIVTDSRGRLTLEVRDALNSGSAGTEDEVSTPAADDAIAKAAERVQAETNGKVPVINPNSMAALGIEVVDVRIKQPNDITFFKRFQDDILAGRKTITLRDESESHFKAGDILRVGRYEDDGYFCTIEVTGTATVTLDTLNEDHALQENMTLSELKLVITEIYPNQTQFYVIDFKCL
jgi:membrane protease subunit HflC